MAAEAEQLFEFDIPAIARELAAGAAFDRIEPWLNASCADPQRFHAALLDYISKIGSVAPKSRPGESYDLYHDLIVRNLRQGRNALVYEEPGAGWRRLSYDELHARASRLAAAWAESGVEAGQCVAIIYPLGGEAAVAYAAALRLGLVICALPPRGATFLRNRLAALTPDRVATAPRYATLIGAEYAALVLPSGESALEEAEALRTHTYASGDPVARFFSPLGLEPEVFVERAADAIYLKVARDATLLLAIRPEERLAAPGFEALQFQPYLLFCAFFAGGCFVEVAEDALADAELRQKLALKLVGVTPALRDLILASGVPSPAEGWRAWFSNPGEPYEWERWQNFATALGERGVRGFNLVANSALGGALLFSGRGLKPPHLTVLPAPGQPWQLADLAGGGEPTAADTGLYAVTEDDADPATFGHFVLNRTRQGYFFSGSMDQGSRGQICSTRELVQVVETHPTVDAASVVITVAAELLNKTVVTLLVFVDPRRDVAGLYGTLPRELARRIESELGPRALPDRVKIYPLSPRRKEGAVDHDWCRWEYTSGTLDKKSKDELFRMIGRLRRIAVSLEA